MTILLILGEDGSCRTGTTYDCNMISRLDNRQATETWQVGHVRGELAVRLKTISAVAELLRNAGDGDLVEITYRSRTSARKLSETKTIRLAGRDIQPVLMPVDEPPLADSDIVKYLGAGWGEYLTVTYRLVTPEGAVMLAEPGPLLALAALVPPNQIPVTTQDRPERRPRGWFVAT